MESRKILRHRRCEGLRRIAFHRPIINGLLALGDVIAAVLCKPGNSITPMPIMSGTLPVLRWGYWRRRWAGYIHQPTMRCTTRALLRYAIVRVTLTTVLSYLFAIQLPPALGLDQNGELPV